MYNNKKCWILFTHFVVNELKSKARKSRVTWQHRLFLTLLPLRGTTNLFRKKIPPRKPLNMGWAEAHSPRTPKRSRQTTLEGWEKWPHYPLPGQQNTMKRGLHWVSVSPEGKENPGLTTKPPPPVLWITLW